MQHDCVKGRVECGTVYGDMHSKDLKGSMARVGYCIPVPDFYIVLHGLCCGKKQHDGLKGLLTEESL